MKPFEVTSAEINENIRKLKELRSTYRRGTDTHEILSESLFLMNISLMYILNKESQAKGK